MPHLPAVQAAVPLAAEQTLPQAPQFAVSDPICTSQPLAALPSQSAQPARQPAIAQVPVAQVPMALAGLHFAPQPPQLVLVFVGVSQPVAGVPEQLTKPILHIGTQTPAVQAVEVAFTMEHALPQAPQLAASLPVFTSHPSLRMLRLQSAKPLAQAPVQEPLVQATAGTLLAEHAEPQKPQLEGSVASVDSQPLATLPSQSR